MTKEHKHVMCEYAALGNGMSIASKSIVPGQLICTMIGTVHIMFYPRTESAVRVTQRTPYIIT